MKKLNTIPAFLPLTGLYEPSAIQQLADGRFLVVEDEKQHSFSLVSISASGDVKSTPLNPGWFQSGNPVWKLDDLEGLALDGLGYLYAVTSHSRDDDGNEKKSREKLVRFRIEGERVVAPVVVGGLKPALVAAHPLLAAAALIADVKSAGGLNIEALEISPEGERLLIGFRSPLQGSLALIASVENLSAVFEAEATPQVSNTLQTLYLDGHGIRGMAYVASLDGYLIVSGPASRGNVAFGLWFWSGQPDALARRVTVAGLAGFERAEGVCPAVIDGVPRIVIVSDDGSRKEGRFARLVLLEPGQLQIAP
ncbi:DUF3616 domain-containing protein [Polaromonas sp.]|uniref:DUF3616 domain-containing protein n=1 Tax=Polaromonas sp. TaxID=1869339 RepID=UPI0017FCF3E3|nr:DUF3616 domain-containing protein [Polaromonas sp.]NMM05858.1 DUF3616 domain-containing protein [Polaromonas sp.]